MKVSVRKSGCHSRPWEARCREHSEEETYLFPESGAVAFNTRGVGNRLWHLAMIAALAHHNRYHAHQEPTS